MKPERGGVRRLPAPHPMKKMEERRPVTFVFFATHEKQEPNCHEIKNPAGVLQLLLQVQPRSNPVHLGLLKLGSL